MMEFNRLLERQIRRKFGNKDEIPADMLDLIQSISQTYDQFEKDRLLTERSLDLSSEEMLEKAQELRDINEELKQFTYATAHDLKSPLRTIASYIQLIEKRLELDKDTQGFFDQVVSGAKRMNVLLDGLLDYAKINKGVVEYQPINVVQCVKNCIHSLSDLIETNEAKIVYNGLPTVMGESFFIHQLFQNLLENAIKYRKREVSPIIHIDAKEREDRYWFAISDNGIGIKKEYMEEVFKVFRRLHTYETYEGSGIGLAICKKIVQRYEGEIKFDEQYTNGCRILFSLPLLI